MATKRTSTSKKSSNNRHTIVSDTNKSISDTNSSIDSTPQLEQVLYIGPEENITEVRERLASTAARCVALVVPPNTHLSGYVAWKLLYKSALALSKDVSIVSVDPQVRAIAQSVQLRVMASLPVRSSTQASSA